MIPKKLLAENLSRHGLQCVLKKLDGSCGRPKKLFTADKQYLKAMLSRNRRKVKQKSEAGPERDARESGPSGDRLLLPEASSEMVSMEG